jgi:hypothetical protein
MWSAATVLVIVATGLVAKGGRSRARHFSLLECGSDATRCSSLLVRGFFASSAKTLRVTAESASSLLDLGAAPNVPRTLVLDQGDAVLEDLRGRPWETLLVREDGFADLGGAIGLQSGTIANRLPHALVGVVARSPGGELRYLARIDPGSSVSIESGRVLGTPIGTTLFPTLPGSPAKPHPPLTIHRLESYRFAHALDTARPGSGDAWSAIEATSPDGTDFWPDDAPVLIGEIEGADPSTTDSGLAVDRTRVLVRVVGNEETP